MPGVLSFLKERTLLIVMTGVFAALALDIAVPAVALSVMGLSRWLVSMDLDLAQLEGKAA